MCPEFERVERIVQKMVDKSEKVLTTGTPGLARSSHIIVPSSRDGFAPKHGAENAQAL